MSNYTEADVDQDAQRIEDEMTEAGLIQGAVLDSLPRLRDAALEGAKVPALVQRLSEVEDALKWERVAFEDRRVRLESREREVSALQARVAELERERGEIIEEMEEVRGLLNDAEEERDALRAQVLRAQDAAYAEAFSIWGDAVRARQVAEAVSSAALSAPPAETSCGPCADHECAVHVHARCEHCPPAETMPVPEAPLLCAACSERGKRAHAACGTAGCECFCGRIRVVTGEAARALVASAETTPAPERAEDEA